MKKKLITSIFFDESRPFYLVYSCVLLLVVLAFAIQWLYPLFIEHLSSGKYSFVPLRNSYFGYDNDKYFYYTHIREIIFGNFPSFDPASFEHKHQFNSHATYMLSLLMCSLGGLFTKNIAHAYYFNYLVYPAINFAVVFLLIRTISLDRYWSLLFALLILFQPSYLQKNYCHVVKSLFFNRAYSYLDFANFTFFFRTPNVLFTSIPLFLLAYFIFIVFELNKKTWLNYTAIAILLVTSAVTSIPNFLVSFALFFSVIIAYLYKHNKRMLVAILAGSTILAIPGVYLIWKTQHVLFNNVEMLKMIKPPYPYFNRFDIEMFRPDFLYIACPVIIFSIARYPRKKFILSASYGILFGYIALSLVKGSYVAFEFFDEGAKYIFTALMMSSLILSAVHLSDDSRLNKRLVSSAEEKIKKWPIKGCLTVVVLFIAMSAFFFQYALIKKSYTSFNDKDFSALTDWSSQNLTTNDVAITLDSDLITNLIIYAPINMYLPPAILSPASIQERFVRFMEIAKLYGMNEREFRNLLDNILPWYDLWKQHDPAADFFRIRLALLDLVLFYVKHYVNTPYPFTADEKDALVKQYKEILSIKNGLTYRANVLLISRFDEHYIKQGSVVSTLMRTQKPIFTNSTYKVYFLTRERFRNNL